MIEIIIAISIGIFLGIFTGLIPGLHVNLISILALSISPFLLTYTTPTTIAIFIISLALTHTFLDSIPSIFLGAPDDAATALSVLPGHKLLLQGRGYEAVKLTALGSLIAVIIVVSLTPLLIPLTIKIYPTIKAYIPHLLILSAIYLIYNSKKARYWSFLIFTLSGILGLAVLNIPTLKQPLLPLLSGLFGTSQLILSYKNNLKIPQQKITKMKIKTKETIKSLTACTGASTIVGFLPGIGSAQAAILAMQAAGKTTLEGFLVMVGGINTLVMGLSIVALYTIDRARNGAIVTVSKLIETITTQDLILFLSTTLIVAGLVTFLTLILARIFSKYITKLNYKKLCLSIIALITLMVFIFSNFLGLLVLLVSTSLGMIPPLKGISRSHLMGCLMIPVIIFFII